MLFMVIEQFKHDAVPSIGRRFRDQGRMLPANVSYIGSWVDLKRQRCFQLMDAPDESSLLRWTRRWTDLVDFDIVPVVTSSEFWSERLS
jgi:hypothetical protein